MDVSQCGWVAQLPVPRGPYQVEDPFPVPLSLLTAAFAQEFAIVLLKLGVRPIFATGEYGTAL